MSRSVERRVWIRYDYALQSTCRPMGQPTADGWTATVLNVSAGGIRIRLPQEFAKGAILLIEIRGDSPITLQARVIYSTELEAGYYEVGCSFLRELDEAELKTLLL